MATIATPTLGDQRVVFHDVSWRTYTMHAEERGSGAEADESYYIRHEEIVREREEYDPAIDPPPDLAVEVDLSSTSSRRMLVYAELGISELWQYDGERLAFKMLGADRHYHVIERSMAFPACRAPICKVLSRGAAPLARTLLRKNFDNGCAHRSIGNHRQRYRASGAGQGSAREESVARTPALASPCLRWSRDARTIKEEERGRPVRRAGPALTRSSFNDRPNKYPLMLLEPDDLVLFFRLHRTLMFFVNQRLNVVPLKVASPDDFAHVAPELRLQVRDALNANLRLIDAFTSENPFELPNDELEIVRSWRHLVAGRFYIFRELKKYTVFLAGTSTPTAYGVVVLSQPFQELVGPYLPVLVDAVLLPFKGRIVYDSMLNTYNISFGGGIRRGLNESYKELKARQGIVMSLSVSSESRPAKASKAKRISQPPPKELADKFLAGIKDCTDAFCAQYLNEEYAVLCRKLADKLARKRPSPLLSGHPRTWVSGIVRTIGWVNSPA